MPSESRFEPCSQRHGLFLVIGCRQPICTKCGASGGLLRPFPAHMVELEGCKELVDTGKLRGPWSVPTLSLCLAVLNGFQGCFGPKMAVFGPRLQFLKMRSATCDTCSRTPALRFWSILCVILPDTHRYHPQKFRYNPKHHDGLLIFAHFARAAGLLAACCLLLAAAGKPGRSTLDPKKGYKTKTGSTSSVILTLTLTVALTSTLAVPLALALTLGSGWNECWGPNWRAMMWQKQP